MEPEVLELLDTSLKVRLRIVLENIAFCMGAINLILALARWVAPPMLASMEPPFVSAMNKHIRSLSWQRKYWTTTK
jgi:hypothetical protein